MIFKKTLFMYKGQNGGYMNFFILTDILLLCLILWIYICLGTSLSRLRASFVTNSDSYDRSFRLINEEIKTLKAVKVMEKPKPKSPQRTSSQKRKIVNLP